MRACGGGGGGALGLGGGLGPVSLRLGGAAGGGGGGGLGRGRRAHELHVDRLLLDGRLDLLAGEERRDDQPELERGRAEDPAGAAGHVLASLSLRDFVEHASLAVLTPESALKRLEVVTPESAGRSGLSSRIEKRCQPGGVLERTASCPNPVFLRPLSQRGSGQDDSFTPRACPLRGGEDPREMPGRVTKKSARRIHAPTVKPTQFRDLTRTRFRGRFWNLPEYHADGCPDVGCRTGRSTADVVLTFPRPETYKNVKFTRRSNARKRRPASMRNPPIGDRR